MDQVWSRKSGAILVALLVTTGGCASTQNGVVAATGTVIGVELGTQQGTGAPTGVLGYRRAEFAHVPTNRGISGANGGAAEPDLRRVANVVMELNYDGSLSNDGSIYQRLAVGTEAVQAGSAVALFAKGRDGILDASTAAALSASAGITIANADKVANCLSKDGKLNTNALKTVMARATLSDESVVKPYAEIFGNSLPDATFGAILKQNAELAKVLAKHVSEADCVGR